MGQRQELQDLLVEITPHVYFQPPANVQMEYPCIVYKRDYIDTKFADNAAYRNTRRYQVTVIDRNPDSPIVEAIAELPLCIFAQNFVTDNLHHDIFTLYF